MYTMVTEARNFPTEPHSAVIFYEQGRFTCWQRSSFAYNSFGQQNIEVSDVVGMQGILLLAGGKGMSAPGLLPSNPVLWIWLSPAALCIPDVALLTWQDDEWIQSHPVIKQQRIQSCSAKPLHFLSHLSAEGLSNAAAIIDVIRLQATSDSSLYTETLSIKLFQYHQKHLTPTPLGKTETRRWSLHSD